MSDNCFQIHAHLQADSHSLCHWQGLHVRLHHNATLPWIIIIPAVDTTEFCDLDPDWQLKITRLSQCLGQHFKDRLGSQKINFAAIGNVVQQLHIHVIGRHEGDPLWPDVVWGNPLPVAHYSDREVTRWRQSLNTLVEALP